MRLSSVIELLLILLLIAFAAYGRVIDHDEKAEERAIKDNTKQSNLGISTLSLKQAADNVNRYCTCNQDICNCCRDFHIPLVQLQGPGCASLQYLQGDNLAVQLSFGDNILTSTVVSGRNPKPVCVPLPGGFTKFCGRVYSIEREAKDHFKACLGLELQSATELEASLRVSCFRFGPDGLKLRPSEPLPIVETEVADDDDDDDDLFDLGGDDDDEEEEAQNNSPLANSVPNSSTEEDEEEDEDDDILGFGALLDAITGDDETTTKKPKGTTPAPLLQFTIPILTKPTSSPIISNVEGNIVNSGVHDEESANIEEENNIVTEDELAVTGVTANEAEELVTQASNKVLVFAKPDKVPTKKYTASDANKKKPTITSSSINAIDNEGNKKKKQPLKKPVKGEDDDDDDDDILSASLDDDDDEEELLGEGDDDEKDSEEDEDKVDDSENDKDEEEDEDEKADIEDLDDDDDEEEDAVISALVYDEKDGKKKGKVKKPYESSGTEEDEDDDDDDYGLGMTGLLARSRHSRNSRQSKVMRL